uniref:Serine/threonine-protein phosphatase 4 regulatory subunit 2 n=1 Tax=Ditylenchus dipsaci TaxID=166011 RepID=A0A915CZT2_9BILA
MVQSVTEARRQQFQPSSYQTALSNFSPLPKDEEQKPSQEFTKATDPLVDEFFEFVASTGRTGLSWDVIKPAFIWKLQTVINDMLFNEAEDLEDDIAKENVINSESIKSSRQFILDKAKSFDGIPFTIQRLCELITTPTRHYKTTEKYLHALEKNINVVTTITESGDRVTGIEDFAPEDDNSPVPVERNFIVSVDELDEPLPTTAGNGVTIDVKPQMPNGVPSSDAAMEPLESTATSSAAIDISCGGEQPTGTENSSLEDAKEEKMETD